MYLFSDFLFFFSEDIGVGGLAGAEESIWKCIKNDAAVGYYAATVGVGGFKFVCIGTHTR